MNMLKIIIVDDEPLVRMGARSCIPWEEHEFCFAGEASDGQEALELVEQTDADIILTDIRMPNMDGIELIRALKQRSPHTHVIVLSCINEMETVRQALLLGADDYILKLSLKPAHMLEILTKLREKILAEREALQQKESYDHMISDHLYVIKGNLLSRFLSGAEGEAQTLHSLDLIEPNGFSQEFYPILTVLDGVADFQHFLSHQPDFWSVFRSLIQPEQLHVSYLYDETLLLWVDSKACHRDVLAQFILPSLCRRFQGTFGHSLSFSLPDHPVQFSQLPETTARLQEQMQHRFYRGYGCILIPESSPAFSSQSYTWLSDTDTLIKQAVDSADFTSLRSYLHAELAQIQVQEPISPDKLKEGATHFMNRLLLQTGFYDRVPSANLHSDELYQSETILCKQTIGELEAFIFAVLDNIEMMLKQKDFGGRREIMQAKKYVYDHIDQDITTDEVARHVNISRSYFSSLFKREEGINFVDFVNQAKMEFAHEVLASRNCKIYEVAAMVGISSETYFSKLFKKYIGISPSKVGKK